MKLFPYFLLPTAHQGKSPDKSETSLVPFASRSGYVIDSGQLKVMKSLQEFLNSFSFPKGEASTLNLLSTAYSHLTLLGRDLDVSGAAAASLPPLCNKPRTLIGRMQSTYILSGMRSCWATLNHLPLVTSCKFIKCTYCLIYGGLDSFTWSSVYPEHQPSSWYSFFSWLSWSWTLLSFLFFFERVLNQFLFALPPHNMCVSHVPYVAIDLTFLHILPY